MLLPEQHIRNKNFTAWQTMHKKQSIYMVAQYIAFVNKKTVNETPHLVVASFFECTYHLYFSSIFMSNMPINPYNMLISPVIYI